MARVESKTFIVTKEKGQATPSPLDGIKGQLAQWMSPEDYEIEFQKRFPGSMKGRNIQLRSCLEIYDALIIAQ